MVTGTIAIGGLAAWIWSEREHDHDHEGDDHGKPPRPQTGGVGQQPYPPQGAQPYSRPPPPPSSVQQGPSVPPGATVATASTTAGGEAASYYDQSQTYRSGVQMSTTESRDVQSSREQGGVEGESTWYDRVTGMFQRTPSPQQFLSSAGKQVSAGMAALGSILEDNGEEGSYDERREYDSDGRRKQRRRSDETLARAQKERSEREKEGFSDHERWSEEAEEQSQRIGIVEAESERRAESARTVREEKGKARAKKAVAVVVSADTDADISQADEGFSIEHAVSLI